MAAAVVAVALKVLVESSATLTVMPDSRAAAGAMASAVPEQFEDP